MSINVNLSGNPVLIRNGKMLNSCNKGEFEKRRLMRLQQVRQQSKTIAEKLRKKVHQNLSTTTRTSDFEQKSEEQLQSWQAKKLLQLQNQYQDALDEIGLGHRQVDSVLDVENKFNRQHVINNKLAEERGRNALDKLQIDKNEQNIKQAIPIQRKKIVRDIEKNRAANLNKTHQNKQFKTKKQKKHSNGVQEKENQEKDELNLRNNVVSTTTKPPEVISKEIQTTPSLFEEEQIKDKFVQTSETEQQFPKDTRISQRIKLRQLLNPSQNNSEILDDIKSDDDVKIETEKPKIVCCHHCQCDDMKIHDNKQQEIVEGTRKSDEIPIKPKIKLKQKYDNSPTTTTATKTTNYKDKVNQGDYRNRLSHDQSSSVRIDRITDDDFTTSPILSDHELDDKKQQREKDAKLRGKKALERERINRDYRELLQKLPLLQKQEYLLDANGKDNNKFHMSDERLKEIERSKQNRLDNAYEKLFVQEPKATIITLPKWDTDLNKEKLDKNLQDELKQLLDNLQQQKDELLRENEKDIKKDDKKRKRILSSPNYSDNDVNNMESKTTQTKFPRKKTKTHKKPNVLVLQNNSTQTTPKIETDVATSPMIPIIIEDKNQQQQKQKICPTAHVPCTCDIEMARNDDPYEILIKFQRDNQPEVIVNPPPNIKCGTTWRQQLSQHSPMGTTTTSYLSPPNCSKSSSTNSGNNDCPPCSKLKLPEISNINGNLDPRLLKYIKKLIDTTKQHIDELSTSSPSDVSTPSQSIVNLPSNAPLKQLRNVMKYFNLSSNDIKRALSPLENSSSIHYNSSESSIEKLVIDNNNNNKQKTYIDQYTEIVDACNKKISNLTDMIDKVRAEKQKMLIETPSNSYTNESTTATTTINDEAIRKLFEIDLSYAQKLKKLTPRELALAKKDDEVINDEELLERYRRLLEVPPNEKQKDTSIALNIPKLPKFDMISTTNNSKPPPSKGLLTPQLNLGTPHELSTIQEADGQVSTAKPDRQDKPFESIKTNEAKLSNENSDKSEIEEAMEEMLTSIGMAWAIPTLRKTRKTLALESSSSSSIDLRNTASTTQESIVRNINESKNESKDNLKNFLMKQLTKSNSDSSKSAIDSQEKQQLTSTPVFGNNPTGAPNGGGLFSGENDLSSVQEGDSGQVLGSTTSSNKQQDANEEQFCDFDDSKSQDQTG